MGDTVDQTGSDAYDRLLQAIGEHGLSIVDTADPQIFAEAATAVPGSPISGDVIDACYPQTPIAERWFCVHDQAGRWISTQAARLDHIDRVSLEDFVVEKACQLHGPGAGIKTARLAGSVTLDSLIGGPSIYLYRMAIAGGAADRRYRDQKLSGLLSVAFRISLYRQWNPENLFGLIAPPLFESGFVDRCEFHHMI